MTQWRRFIASLLLLFLFVSLLMPGVRAAEGTEESESSSEAEFFDYSVFDGKRIGVQTGSIQVDLIPGLVKDAQMVYFTESTDFIPALQSGKVDACFNDEPVLRYLAARVSGIRAEKIESQRDAIAMVLAKTEEGDELRAQLDSFIIAMRESGELERLQDKWLNGSDEELVMEDYRLLPATNGTITVGSSSGYPPFQYLQEDLIVGLEPDLLARFCKEYGYGLEIVPTDFSAIIVGVETGKFDIGSSCFSVTEERKKSVNFTETILYSYTGVIFRDESAESESGNSFSDRFTATFLTENRWEQFLSGALVTLRITVFSILFGSALGFGWYLLYRRGQKLFTRLSDALLWLLNGLPTVVVLMIFYYLIFASDFFSGEQVSIFCFTLLFAGFLLHALEQGEKAVDGGQALAAEALGYSRSKAFFRIIFPQAARFVWPNYIGEIRSHIKATAVVGYITVVDITKVGDLIRGRTYDAFFPLISVAIAYFIMAALLQGLARWIEKRTNPYERSQKTILKGVELR